MSNISFIKDVDKLIKRDRDLAKIIDVWGYPPQWQREPGFSTLIRIILEQQVSYASAKAAFNRLNDAVVTLTKSEEAPSFHGGVSLTPESFLALDDAELKAIGFSRQKTKYGRGLAEAIINQTLNLAQLEKLDDRNVRKSLTQIKGIGDWTADIYLMMALQRQDVFPAKDLAIAIAVKEIKDLSTRPTAIELGSIAELWKPQRAIATKILWHYYLNRKSTKKQSL